MEIIRISIGFFLFSTTTTSNCDPVSTASFARSPRRWDGPDKRRRWIVGSSKTIFAEFLPLVEECGSWITWGLPTSFTREFRFFALFIRKKTLVKARTRTQGPLTNMVVRLLGANAEVKASLICPLFSLPPAYTLMLTSSSSLRTIFVASRPCRFFFVIFVVF